MYAIIETGGKQYKVSKGDILEVELLPNKEQVTFNKVLLIVDKEKVSVGTPYVPEAKVVGKVLGTEKGPKVTTFKYKNKINYHRTIGHRQVYSKIKVEEIKYGS